MRSRRLGPPILFLDFDGVLSEHFPKRPEATAIERLRADAVQRLDRIVRTTSAEVVVSSTWRYNPAQGVGHEAEQLRRWLALFGYTGKISGITPHLPSERRALEIQSYLDAMPEVPRALAILEDFEPMEHLTPWTVRTVYERRLTDADAERAVALLQRRGPAARPSIVHARAGSAAV